MGKIDILSKRLLNDKEVFADICNHLFHKGRRVVTPESLVAFPTEHTLHFCKDGAQVVTSRFRDTFMGYAPCDGPIRLLIGLEAQSQEDFAMPLRCLCYDAMCCLGQAERLKAARGSNVSRKYFLSHLLPGERVIRAVTGVVHLGMMPPEGPTTVSALMASTDENWPGGLVEYTMMVFVLCTLSDQEVATLCLKLRCLAKCLKYANDAEKMRRLLEADEDLKHTPSVVVLLLKEILNIEIEVNDEESVDMCYAIEELIRIAAAEKEAEGEKRGVQIGEKRGMQIGEKRGEEKTLRCVAASMLARQIPRDEVIDFLVGTFSMSPEKAMGYLS